MDAKFLPNGDRAVSVIFPNEISTDVSCCVLAMCAAIDAAPLMGIVNCIPAYHTLLVEYDPVLLTYGQTVSWLRGLSFEDSIVNTNRIVSLPVCYGGIYGPDLDAVASYTGMSASEVIRLHTEGSYRVYMLGFRPGFPYLGGLDARIAVPRKKTPRAHVDHGSVGIAGHQTGVYPEDSPGGWNIIGRTPIHLYDERTHALLRPGDTLRFVSINAQTYEEILEKGGWTLW